MGSSASKAAGASSRRFPSRAPNTTPKAPPPIRQPEAAWRPDAAPSAKPKPKPKGRASASKTDDIISDSIHPEAGFAERLHQMGIVNPTPTFSPSSQAGPERAPGPRYHAPSKNPTLVSLEARRMLQRRADAEFDAMGRKGSPGREFLDVGTICRALAMREKGIGAKAIEERLRLKPGVVARLGRVGVAAPLGDVS